MTEQELLALIEQVERDNNRPSHRQPSGSEINKQRAADWGRYVDGRIAKALVAHDRIRIEATGAAIGYMRSQLRKEIASAIGQLRADLMAERVIDAAQFDQNFGNNDAGESI